MITSQLRMSAFDASFVSPNYNFNSRAFPSLSSANSDLGSFDLNTLDLSQLGQSIEDVTTERLAELISAKTGVPASIASTAARATIGTAKGMFTSRFGDKVVKPNPPTAENRISSGGSRGYSHPPLDTGSAPIEASLNTGIKPNLYTPMYHTSTGFNSPMYISGITLKVPTSSTALLTFFNKIITFIFQNNVQASISFSLGNAITASSLAAYINSVIDALSVYFFYDSVIGYCNVASNTNQAMFDIRQSMTATDINNFTNLRRVLQLSPIPPNLLSFLFWLNQNYLGSSLPGSPIFKVVSNLDFHYKGVSTSLGDPFLPDGAIITTVIDELAAQQGVSTILCRACPKWCENTLPSGGAPVHDTQFTTMFANLPYWFSNGSISEFGPLAATSTSDINYQLFTNELDGAAFAMTSIFDQALSDWVPSIVKPRNWAMDGSNTSNRLTYTFTSGKAPAFHSSFQAGAFFSLGRYDTYTVLNSAQTTWCRHDAEVGRGVNSLSVNQTTFSFLEWLMSFGTFGTLPDRRVYKGSSNGGNNNKSKYKSRNRK